MSELLDERTPDAGASPLRAEAVMRREVLTVDACAPIEEVWEAMRATGVEHAVVLRQGVCLGIVTLPELWVAWSLELAPVAPRSVLTIVTPTPCISEDTELRQLCQILLRSRNGAAMVLGQQGDLTGLVTADDVLALLGKEEDCPC